MLSRALLLLALATEGLALSLSRPGLISPAVHGSRAARVVLTAQPPQKTQETPATSAAQQPPAKSDVPEVHMDDKAPADTVAGKPPAKPAPAAASTAPAAKPAAASTGAAAPASKAAPAVPQPTGSPFTLEKRGDGWDDLREAIAGAGQERQASYEALQKKYVKPASRVAKVLVDELAEATPLKAVLKAPKAAPPVADIAPPSAPKATPLGTQLAAPAAKPKPPAVLNDKPASRAVSWLSNLLDDAATSNQKKKASAAAAKKVLKKPSSKDVSVASFNLALLLAIPTLTLAALAYLLVETVLK
jgi:hypothetical protein